MSEFEASVAEMHAAIEAHFGDPFRVERSATGQRAEPVQLVIEHGVAVDISGEGPTLNSTVDYRLSVVGVLEEGDRITLLKPIGEGYALTSTVYTLGHLLDSDGDLVTRVIYPGGSIGS